MGTERAYPTWKKTIPVLIDEATVREAERWIDFCEACAPDESEIPFDYVLDSITGCEPELTDYVLEKPAKCPRCSGEVLTGYWRWYDSQKDGRKVFVLPGTLVTLKRE
jgi:hypothetical protein